MINVSDAFRRELTDSSSVLVRGTLTFSDGRTRDLAGDDFMMGSTSFTQAVSSSGSFDIGAAIIGTCSVTLNNMDGRFDSCDFTGAVVKISVGKELGDETTEWVERQGYRVDQPSSYGNVIQLSGLDAMSAFERPYADVATAYPATLYNIVNDICTKCGVRLASANFPRASYEVGRRPDGDSLTCLAVLSFAAQVAGCWCRIDSDDRLSLGWYDLSVWEGESWLNGGSFYGAQTPYRDGDDADGGDFSSYGASAGSADGGGFGIRRYAILSAFSSMTLFTDDVVITGVKVTAQDDVDEADGGTGGRGETVLSGDEGYVLHIKDNPLVLHGEAQTVADGLAKDVAGMRFRPFEASALGDPTAEAGDPVLIVDSFQRMYRSFLTSYTYVVGGYASLGCSAETPSRHSAERYSAVTDAIVKNRNEIEREKTERELALLELAERLASSGGVFTTVEKREDGSSVYYFHNKSKLAESDIVWKFTAEAVAVSTDGGKTFSAALTCDGDAILSRIYAIGINASFINSGVLRSAVIQGGTISGTSISGGTISGATLHLDDGAGTTVDVNGTGFSMLSALAGSLTMNATGGINLTNKTGSSINLLPASLAMSSLLGTLSVTPVFLLLRNFTGSSVSLSPLEIKCSSKESVIDISASSILFKSAIDDVLDTCGIVRPDHLLLRDDSESSRKFKFEVDAGGLTLRTPDGDILGTSGAQLDIMTSSILSDTFFSDPIRYKQNNSSDYWYGLFGKSVNRFGFQTSGGTTRLTFVNGLLTYSVTVSLSDERLKESIEDSSASALEVVNKIRHRKFRWREGVCDGAGVECGYVAQEMAEVEPSFAFVSGEGESETMQISEPNLLPYVTKAIQELSAKLDAAERRLAKLEGRE